MTSISGTHSALKAFFTKEETPPRNQEEWDHFRTRFSSTPNDLVKPLDKLPADYVEGRPVKQRCLDTALKVCRIVLMIILFPWGLYAVLRYLVQRLVMSFIFPLQNCLVKSRLKIYNTDNLNQARQKLQTHLNRTQIQSSTAENGITTFEQGLKDPYLVRQIILEKNGARYRALMIATAQTLATRKWVLQAPGNAMPIERCAAWYAERYTKHLKGNLLIVHGPGAGGNDGEVPSTDLGEPYELALSCLEKDFDAQDIVLCGHSLGAAAVGQAIKKHTFDTAKRHYVVVRQVGFDTTPNMAYRWFGHSKSCCACSCMGRLTAVLVRWTDCMLDNVEASRILQDKQITEIVIRAGEDRVIPEEASLTCGLNKLGMTQHKKFIYLPGADHNTKRVFDVTVEALETV